MVGMDICGKVRRQKLGPNHLGAFWARACVYSKVKLRLPLLVPLHRPHAIPRPDQLYDVVLLCLRPDKCPAQPHPYIVVADQAEVPGNIMEAEHNRNGDAHRTELRSMLDKGEVKLAQDFADAAVIFQHGEVADDYLLAHVLAVEAVIRGDASPDVPQPPPRTAI